VAVLSARFLAAAAMTAALAAPSPAATLAGKVDVKLTWPPTESRPSAADLGMPGPRDTPDRRRSVVYLEAGPLGAFDQSVAPPGSLDQRNEAFFPYVLAVRAGALVHFPNRDRTYHNVFSFSKVKRFDLGRYPQGQTRSVRFDKPGVIRVFCDIHAHMSAFILVFAHPFFATTDNDGRYKISGVPPGRYSVSVWTDGSVRDTHSLEVPAGDGTLEADFVVR
jgi:plastocyanin